MPADPETCSHQNVQQGLEFLNEPARQCPDCGTWLEQDYEESFDGEEEIISFWLNAVDPPRILQVKT